MVVIHDKFRPVSKKKFDICSQKIALWLVMVVGASITGSYIIENYQAANAERQHEVSISLVRYLATKKTYDEKGNSSKPTVSSRKLSFRVARRN